MIKNSSLPQDLSLNIFNDKKVRGWLIQALVFAIMAFLVLTALFNMAQNLEKAGISSGFGFLSEVSGFEISLSLIEYSRADTYLRAFFVGLLNTLLVSVFAIVFSTIFGFLLGVFRLSSNWLVSRIAALYIEMVRNVPLLLQILFWYIAILNPLPRPRQALDLWEMFFLCNRGLIFPKAIPEAGFMVAVAAFGLALIASIFIIVRSKRHHRLAGKTFPAYRVSLALVVLLPLVAFLATGAPLSWELPTLSGFNFKGGITVLPEFIALTLSLTLYASAFIGENVRAGILSVATGQKEAAAALGIRPNQSMRLIVIPQAMRLIIPPLTSQHLTTVKNSSLAVVIGYPDLIHVFAGTTLNQTGQAVEIIGLTMVVYLFISLVISFFMNWYNKKMTLVER